MLCLRTIALRLLCHHVFAQLIAYMHFIRFCVRFEPRLEYNGSYKGNRPHSATMAGGHLRCIPVFPLYRGFTNGGRTNANTR